MYCSACGSPLAPGLSYCNRCGNNLMKERQDPPHTKTIAAFLTAITLIGICGLIVMVAGSLALRNGARLEPEVVGVFMFMTFVLVLTVEVYLCRLLSRLSRTSSERNQPQVLTPPMPLEMRGSQPRVLSEPIPSVTENTTRTLQYQESSQR